MIEQIFSPELVHALGWTLVHTLWQAALFALLLGLLLVLLRKYSALTRYVVAIGLLAAFFLTAGMTFGRLYTSPTGQVITNSEMISGSTESIAAPQEISITQPDPNTTITKVATRRSPSATFRQRVITYYDNHLPLIVTLWLMGVLILQLRFLGQLAFLQRLKNYGTERFPARFAPLLQEIEHKLGITKPIRYLTSFRVKSPFTAGWLRPVILFPAALLEELNEAQLRTIVAHELAHVKRYDFLVNLGQTLLCILFFYHPAVWWMSSRVEEEREHCCDDLAISVTGEKVGYAKTLLQLKEAEISGGRLAMGLKGNGKGFQHRIKRLLGSGLGTSTYGEGFTTAVIIACCIGLALNLSGQQDEARTQVQSSPGLSLVPPPPPPSPPPPGADEAFEYVQAGPGLSQEEADKVNRIVEREVNAQRGEMTVITDKFKLFMNAIYDGNKDMVEYFLEEEKFDLNQTDEQNFTPLMAAAKENHTEIARMLIAAGAELDFINSYGWTALLEAADEGAYETAKLFLDKGAQPDLKGSQESRTPLAMAASEGHPQLISLLVQAGADIFSMGGSGHPLLEAAKEGQLKNVRLLLDLGADINTADDQGRTALMYAASEGNQEIVRYLLRNGANPNDADQNGQTALFYAMEEDEINIAKEIERFGGVPTAKRANANNGYSRTDPQVKKAYFRAIDDDHYETVEYILDQGMDPRTTNAGGINGLELAAREGKMSVLRLLHDRSGMNGRDLNQALQLAAREGKTEAVRFLLAEGADPLSHDNSRLTPLELAAREGKMATVRLLLDEGGEDGNLENALKLAAREGKTDVVSWLNEELNNTVDLNEPFLLAAREGKFGTVKYLLQQGADLNAGDQYGNTALSMAAREGKADVVQYLLQQGAEVNGSKKGCSPLFLAARERKTATIRLLAQQGADLERGCSFRDIDYHHRSDERGQANSIAIYENATPLHVALTETSAPAVNALVAAGANVNATIRKIRFTANRQLDYRDSENLSEAQMRRNFTLNYEADGWTPLMEAVESANSDLVILLLKNGADRSAATRQGLTALKLAQDLKLTDITRILQ